MPHESLSRTFLEREHQNPSELIDFIIENTAEWNTIVQQIARVISHDVIGQSVNQLYSLNREDSAILYQKIHLIG